MEAVAQVVAPAKTATQAPPRGTGDAVRAAKAALASRLEKKAMSPMSWCCSAMPRCLRSEAIAALLVGACDGPPEAAIVVAGMRPVDPSLYGRLVLDPDGGLARIVEARARRPPRSARSACVTAAIMRSIRAICSILSSKSATTTPSANAT